MFTNEVTQLLQNYLVTRDRSKLEDAIKLLTDESCEPSLQEPIVKLDMTTETLIKTCVEKGSLRLSTGYRFEDSSQTPNVDVREDELIRVVCSNQEPESVHIFMVTYLSGSMLILSPLVGGQQS